jgi:hypothetical protein
MPTTTRTEAQLPEVISRYQAAHDRRDTEAALAAFHPEARVVDEGRERRGLGEVREWLDTTATEFTYTRSFLGAEEEGPGRYLVTCHLEGDFPGGQVDLRYRFEVEDGRIRELVIAP